MGDNALNFWNHRNQQRSRLTTLCFWHPLFACIFPTSTSLVDQGLPLLSMTEDHVLLSNLFFLSSIVSVNFSKFLIIFVQLSSFIQNHPFHHLSACIGWLQLFQQVIKMNKIQEKLHLRTLCISTAPPVNVLSPINAPSLRLNGGCLAWKCRAAVIGTINGAFEPRMHSLCCSWCIGVHCRALPGLRRPLDAGAEEPLRTMHLSRPLTALTRYPPPPPSTTTTNYHASLGSISQSVASYTCSLEKLRF